MVLIHGRGAPAQSILQLAGEFQRADFAYLAPQAAGYQWYPQRFIVPREANEPHLSSALVALDQLVGHINEAGIPSEKIMLVGFSQGACLAVEYAACYPRRYGGVAALSGGLIGADDELGDYQAGLDGTPILLGVSDVDSHIPLQRVKASTRILSENGAQVDERVYPGLGHTINSDEIERVRAMMDALTGDSNA